MFSGNLQATNRFQSKLFIVFLFILSLSISARVHAQTVAVGPGSYTTTLPAGATAPSAQIFNTVAGPKPTHRFWTAKSWYADNIVNGAVTFGGGGGGPYNMFSQPLGMQTTASGLLMGFDAAVNNGGTFFQQPFEGDLTIGVAGLNAASVNVSGYTDWTVDFNFGPITTRVGRGMPFVYVTTTGANPTVSFAGQPTVFSNNGNILGVSIANNNYGLFCPAGGTWSGIGGTVLTCNLPAGHNYFSLALLPNQAALTSYAGFAFSFPTNTQVSWSYNPTTSAVTTTYTVTTQAKEGTQTGFLMALYPHQYSSLSGSAINTTFTYPSSRGTLKVLQGSSFTTVDTFHGILPFMPSTNNFNSVTLRSLIDSVANEANHFTVSQSGGGTNTYDIGKDLARVAHLMPIASVAGDTASLNSLQTSLQNELQNWFNGAANGQTSNVFYYNSNWGTMIGYPAAFGTDDALNDHHFHYGYWIHSSAILGLFNPAWIQTNSWGGMVNLLGRDIATPVRNDSMFPFLRHFDVYGGHSWASGQAPFGDGENQESSSEAVNAWTGLILFAIETGNTQLRDAAIWMYTMETNSIFDYWFNDGPVNTFPAGFTRVEIANVFDGKGDTGTFFSGQIELEHGIEFLPFHGGSFYLGRDPAYSQRNIAEVTSMDPSAFASTSVNWPDLMEEYEAFYDPTTALSQFNNTSFLFDGESKAHEYYWITNMEALGEVDETVTANTPLYRVFKTTGGVRTHVAFNASTVAATVAFSDGTNLSVPPGSMTSEFGTVTLGAGSTPPPAPPAAPTTLTATAASSSQINLSWHASTTAGVTYNVHRSTTSGFTPSAANLIASGITATTFSNTGLAASTTFFYVVTAVNAGGESAASNQASATTATGGGAATGNTLFVLAGATPTVTGALSFTAGAGASSDTIPADNGTTFDGTPNNPLVYKITGVNATYNGGATQFNLFVDSKTGVGNGVQVQVLYDFTGSGTFGRVETYHYFPTNDTVGFESYTQAQGLESSSGTFAKLSNGTVEIKVWNAIGTSLGLLNASATAAQGSQSAIVLPFGTVATPPTEPTTLTATAASSSQINLSWHASTTAGVTYNVHRGTTSGFAPSAANLIASGITATTFSNTGLTASTTFFYVVTAVNGNGESAASNQASATTSAGATAVGNTLFVLAGATPTVTGTLSFTAGTAASSDTIPADNGATNDGTPTNPLIYKVTGVNGTYNGGATQFALFVDAKTAVGNGVQVQVLYDFIGSGTFSRVETYHYFPTNDVTGFESYAQTQGLESSSGTLTNLSNGTIEIKVWNAIGTNLSFLNASATAAQGNQTKVVLPFGSLTH
jgi:endoglucanase Acf2/predicted small secreted protein